MDTRTRNMTQGHPLRLMTLFALPLMVGNLFQQLYTVVDTAVVGQALGVAALAALGAADWLNWMFLGMIQGITQGFSIPMAHHFGAGQIDQLRKVIGQSVRLAAWCSLVLLLAGQLTARPILVLLQTPGDVLPDALLYLRIIFAGIPVVMAYNLLSSILRAMGDSKTPLQSMMIASAANIALDLLFVLVFRWGIAGAAAATVIAQVISSAICLRQLRKMKMMEKGFSGLAPLEAPMVRQLLRLGSPMAFQNLIIAVGGMIVQSVINGYGVIYMAGFTATNKMYGLLEIAATSYGYALVTYVGQNLGAGKIHRIRQGVHIANLLGLVIAVSIASFMIFFGRSIVGLFISGEPGDVAAATDIGFHYLQIMALFLPVLYYLYVIRATIQGAGNTVLPMLSGVVEFIMRTGVILILPRLIGTEGIYYAEVAAWAGADVVLTISYFYVMRKIKSGRMTAHFTT